MTTIRTVLGRVAAPVLAVSLLVSSCRQGSVDADESVELNSRFAQLATDTGSTLSQILAFGLDGGFARYYVDSAYRVRKSWVASDGEAILAQVEVGSAQSVRTRLDVWTHDSRANRQPTFRSDSMAGEADLDLHYFGRAQDGKDYVAVVSSWDESETGTIILVRQAENGRLTFTFPSDLSSDFGVLSLSQPVAITLYANRFCGVGFHPTSANRDRWVVDSPGGFAITGSPFGCVPSPASTRRK